MTLEGVAALNFHAAPENFNWSYPNIYSEYCAILQVFFEKPIYRVSFGSLGRSSEETLDRT